MDLYGNELINRYKEPLFKYSREKGLKKFEGSNDSCGDKVALYLQTVDDVVVIARHESKGCLLSNVSADFLCELIEGKNLSEIEKITEKEILDLFSLDSYSDRSKCVLLPLKVLKQNL